MAEELKPFTCTYRFEGRPIGITVDARSWDEVSARLRAIGTTGTVEGEKIAEFDAFPSLPVLQGVFRAVRRFLRRMVA